MPSQTIVNRIDPARALAMYDDGASDRQIANACGVPESGICRWRKRHGLIRLACNDNRLTDTKVRRAKNMLKNGATLTQVAAHLGVSQDSIQRIRDQMGDEGLRGTGMSGRIIRARIVNDVTLPHRVERAIGMRVPKDIHIAAVNDMYLELLDGKLPVEQIESAAPRYRSKAFSMAGYNYSTRSIDEENDDGFSLAETLADPMSMRPFEEVLERVFANDD